MVDKIAFENDQISNFEGLVTMTLDRVILHTVVHHSSISTYMPNFTVCGRTLGQIHGRIFETLSKSQSKNVLITVTQSQDHCKELYTVREVKQETMRCAKLTQWSTKLTRVLSIGVITFYTVAHHYIYTVANTNTTN